MSQRKAKPKKPSEVISVCPACGSEELIRMHVDVLCAKCDWLSSEMHVECGGMDNLFAAYVEHFHGGSVIVADEASTKLQESTEPPVEESLSASA